MTVFLIWVMGYGIALLLTEVEISYGLWYCCCSALSLFSESAHQPHMGRASAIEEIRYVVKKQERELDDMREKMRESVSERHAGIMIVLYPPIAIFSTCL